MGGRLSAASAIVTGAALFLTACRGSTPDHNGGGNPPPGQITFATGKDTTGKLALIIDNWNQKHPEESVALLELPESADEQRNAMVQNFLAQSPRYDVVSADVVWTAEFAARGWLEPLEEDRFATDKLLRASTDSAKYEGMVYAAPYTANGGMLYYRSDLVQTPPATWIELGQLCDTVAKAHAIGCYAGQFAQYEGLTVNVSEAIHSTGGSFVEDEGRVVTVDSPQARTGLQLLVDGFARGWIPKEAITYKEEDGRRAFQQGRLLFLRNWPYMYKLANTVGPDSKVVGNFKVAPLPGQNGPGFSTLGGYNLALSTFSEHKESAKMWMEFMQSEETQRRVLTELSQAPVMASLYADPELRREIPYLVTLQQSIDNAKRRPETPNYNAVTLAIQKHSYAALQGRKTVDEAITDMAAALEESAARR